MEIFDPEFYEATNKVVATFLLPRSQLEYLADTFSKAKKLLMDRKLPKDEVYAVVHLHFKLDEYDYAGRVTIGDTRDSDFPLINAGVFKFKPGCAHEEACYMLSDVDEPFYHDDSPFLLEDPFGNQMELYFEAREDL